MSKQNELPKFKALKERVSEKTLEAIRQLGFKRMTLIQSEVLHTALDGADIVATAKTGSGKTLAFLIPVIEVVLKNAAEQKEGTSGIIISPTRELAIQTYSVLQDLVYYHQNITSALVIGGENKWKQSEQLSKGAHIVVSTPGRLFDHMRTKEFDYKNVSCLVLDEADKIFQYGFEEDLKQIVSRLPKNRQTMLFSATQSDRTDALVKSAMRENLQNINTDEDNLRATVDGLKQGYSVCETEYRLWWLHKIMKKTKNSKVMVFFSSCKSVVFHHEFFTTYCEMPVLCIHGKMNQADRTSTITDFYNAEKVTLFCTDLAARGLDIPAVDWIIQFDPPADANEYIHRVGRTARGVGAAGNAVLLLRPEEKAFVDELHASKIYLDKYESWNSYYNLKTRLDAAMENPAFRKLAVKAFEGYMRAMEVRKQKQIFNLITMDVDAVARSFGLKDKPDIDVRIGFSKKHRPRKRKAALLGSDNGNKQTKT